MAAALRPVASAKASFEPSPSWFLFCKSECSSFSSFSFFSWMFHSLPLGLSPAGEGKIDKLPYPHSEPVATHRKLTQKRSEKS